MSKPCRLVNAHRHLRLPADTMYTVAVAREAVGPNRTVIKIRWLTVEREWEVCHK